MNTDKEIIRPRLPEVGEFVRHHGKLIAIEVDPPPKPPPVSERDYIFEEINARGELRRNGEVLKNIQTLTDFYGRETSVKTCIEEMTEYANRKQITAHSEVEVVVVKITHYFRARPIDRENFYDKTFVDFETKIRGSNWNVPEDVETVVWSSRNPK